MNPFTWNKAQWDAAGRHVLTAVTTATPILILLKVITPEQADFWQNTTPIIFASIAGVFLAIGPVYALIQAARSASPDNQAAQTVKNLEAGVPLNGKRDQIIAAVADQPDVKKVEMVDQAKAAEIPSAKVTA